MTSYLTKITTGVAALAAFAAIGTTSAMAIGPVSPGHVPTGLRYSRVEPVITSGQPTSTPSSSMQLNLPPIPGGPIETPTHQAAASVASGGIGFAWSDAAIGALTTAVLCIVLMGLALSVRRRNEPKAA